MKITDIVVFRVGGEWKGVDFPPGDRQAQAMDVYPQPKSSDEPKSSKNDSRRRVYATYVKIRTDEAVSGIFGPIDDHQAFVIQRSLKGFLIGKDPMANEALLDQMLRLNRHGRSGLFMTGISVIDCALWDLKGKALNMPIYRLLGGPTRTEIPAYASMLGFSIDPDKAAEVALEYKKMGFQAQKWFFRYGPADGERGKELNIAMAKAVRDAVGPCYTLMFDAFMGWDVAYAKEMVRALEPLNPAWMEEPIPPERVGGLREINAASRVPIATGEHVYTRWQVKELLVRKTADVIQTDPDWTGGITELIKICALCSAFDTPVVAHGHSLLAALHVAGSQSPNTVPMVEYLIRHQENKQFFHKPIYRPQNGVITLPNLPGLGIILDESKIEERSELNLSLRG